jgi:LPS O-antigen subunit length determinant protein (WzzB/FepE family)
LSVPGGYPFQPGLTQAPAQPLFLHDPEGLEPALDFVEYWRTVRKFKWAILAFALVVTLVAAVVAYVSTPIYEAKTTYPHRNQQAKSHQH